MLSSKFYRTDRQTNKQTRSMVELGPPTKNVNLLVSHGERKIDEKTNLPQTYDKKYCTQPQICTVTYLA